MLKNVLSQSWRRGAHVLQEGHPAEALYACSSRFHSGQVLKQILVLHLLSVDNQV